MANSISKKRAQAEQLRKKRAQAASALAQGAKNPPRAIPVAAKRSRPSVGFVEAMTEPVSPMRYPLKRVTMGKCQEPGGGSSA
jgi:hypothetical protein